METTLPYAWYPDPEILHREEERILRPARQCAFDERIAREDRTLVEGVQRGIAAGGLDRGVLRGRSERLIGHFQALTAAALAVD